MIALVAQVWLVEPGRSKREALSYNRGFVSVRLFLIAHPRHTLLFGLHMIHLISFTKLTIPNKLG